MKYTIKKIAVLCCLALLFAQCTEKKDVQTIHQRIEQYEDSIAQWGGGQGLPNERNEFADRYIQVLLQAHKEDPQHPKIPEYLDKVHMWYITKNEPQQAVQWANFVIENYPTYPNKKMLIESAAILYDSEIMPRDSTKVRQYYAQLIREFPAMNLADKQAIKERLKYNHLSLQEYIRKNNFNENE